MECGRWSVAKALVLCYDLRIKERVKRKGKQTKERRSDVKRKLTVFAIVLIAICVTATLIPMTSRAVVTPAFVAVNDTLLPFSDENMPYVSEGNIFIPHRILERLGVFSVSSAAQERVRVYRSNEYFVVFNTTSGGVTEDQNGSVLPWPSARRIGNIFYIPLRQVCDYFGLRYDVFDVGDDVIPEQQMWGVRITAAQGFSGSNIPTFLSLNKNAMRNAYNEYYAPPPVTTSEGTPLPPTEEPTPSYVNVTIHLSFNDLSAGNAEQILNTLDSVVADGFETCFFVSAGDIVKYPDLIRRISGSGHTIGIWLDNGTLKEYQEVSALLFEAAKVKTLLVSADKAEAAAIRTADGNGLLYWCASWCSDGEETIPDDSEITPVDPEDTSQQSVTDILPTASGERCNLRFTCTDETASTLPDLLSHLRQYEYTVIRITETVTPIR